MNAPRRSAPLVFALGMACLLGWGATASAQFGPSVRFNYQFGISPAMSYNPWLPSLPQVPGRFSYQGYTLSGMGANGPYSVSYGYYRTGGVYSGGYGGGYNPETTTTFGSGYRSGGGKTADYQRSAIANAQKTAAQGGGVSGTGPEFDRWLKDAATRRDSVDPKAPVIDPAFVDPPEEAVLSGEVLNELAARIRDLEKQGKKAQAGLFSPELAGKIVFAGGPAAEAANLYRSADLRYPTPLQGTQYEPLRTDLDKAFGPVSKEAQAGKKTNPADVERLLKAVGKAREIARPVVADAPFAEASDVSDFFARLEAATKYLADEKSTGVAGAKWSAVGATVAEVVQHEAKFGLRFGPVKAGDEAAYYSLHRGLLAYYVGLLQAM